MYIYLLFFVLGSGCFVLGAYFLYRFFWFLWKGSKTEGEVIDISEGPAGDPGSTFFNPVVRFKDEHGRKVTVTYKSQNNLNARWNVGQSLTIYYDPANPKKIMLGSLLIIFLGRLMLFCAGMGLCFEAYYWSQSH